MPTGNIPPPYYKEPWTEDRAGEVISSEIKFTFPKAKRPMEWIAQLVQLIPNRRHREVFLYRYGIIDEHFHTYEEVATRFKFSKARAYQLDQEILDNLQKRMFELETIV